MFFFNVPAMNPFLATYQRLCSNKTMEEMAKEYQEIGDPVEKRKGNSQRHSKETFQNDSSEVGLESFHVTGKQVFRNCVSDVFFND